MSSIERHSNHREPAGRRDLRQVFLGSTIKDLEKLREKVQKTLLQYASAVVFLSESDWIGSYGDTVDKCRKILEESDGYFGIFAYWYGSIPPGFDKSITHLEFDWAERVWEGARAPQMAVFFPKEQSPAQRSLKKAADKLVEKLSPQEQKEHSERLKAFHTAVIQPKGWRWVKYFAHAQELCLTVVSTCWTLRYAALEAASRPVSTRSRKISSAELGRLGRRKQREAITGALSEAASRAEVPAIGMLVSGPPSAGHQEFLSGLDSVEQLTRGRPPVSGRPMGSRYSVDQLIDWAGREAGADYDVGTIAGLAEFLAKALKNQQIVLVNSNNRLQGGLPSFHSDFWTPLYGHLAQLRTTLGFRHRLVLVLDEYSSGGPGWETVTCAYDLAAEEVDYSRLLMLPPLGPIKKKDVRRWLDTLEIEDESAEFRNKIVETALTDEQGNLEGTPSNVFQRLREVTIWPEKR